MLPLALLITAVIARVGMFLRILCGAALIAAVIVAIHHAEVVAHRVGEPVGTLILALDSVLVVLEGAVHLVMFAAFLLLKFVP